MGDGLNIVYIGAGSFRFSTPLFRDICYAAAQHQIPLEIRLCDINPTSLQIMEQYLSQMIRKTNRRRTVDIKVKSSTDRKELLPNADIIYKSISVGIQTAEWFDIHLPLKFGIPQNTGDTVGPGGIFRALRTCNETIDLLKDIAKYCPKAPILNYTNPQSALVALATKITPELQFIGLCHELFSGMKTLKRLLNRRHHLHIKNWEDMEISYGGVNHFAWITKLEYHDQNLYPLIRQDALTVAQSRKFWYRPFNMHLVNRYGYYPYPGGRHIAEFLPEYYNFSNYNHQNPSWNFPVIRNVGLLHWERTWAYRMMAFFGKPFTYVPGPKESGERAMAMTLSYLSNDQQHHVVNIPNIFRNQPIIPQFPSDCIVEVPGVFHNQQIQPVDQVNLPPHIVKLILPYCHQHSRLVKAILGNNFDLILEAMQASPMCRYIQDPKKIEQLTKLMLFYEQDWLPARWQEWIPSYSELKNKDFWVSPKELSKQGHAYHYVKFPPNLK